MINDWILLHFISCGMPPTSSSSCYRNDSNYGNDHTAIYYHISRIAIIHVVLAILEHIARTVALQLFHFLSCLLYTSAFHSSHISIQFMCFIFKLQTTEWLSCIDCFLMKSQIKIKIIISITATKYGCRYLMHSPQMEIHWLR